MGQTLNQERKTGRIEKFIKEIALPYVKGIHPMQNLLWSWRLAQVAKIEDFYKQADRIRTIMSRLANALPYNGSGHDENGKPMSIREIAKTFK